MSSEKMLNLGPLNRPEIPSKAETLPGNLISDKDNRFQDILNVLERANHIASMTHLEDLLEQMLTLMIEVSGATNGTLYLRDRQARELVFKVIIGDEESKSLVGMRIKEGRGIVGSAVQNAKPIVIDDLASDPRWYREIDPERTAHLHNAITLPLLLRGIPIGAVQIFNFVHAELELLQVLGNRMASEIDKVQLLERAHRSNQRLHTLVDILGQIGATLNQNQLIELLTKYAAQLLDAECSRVDWASKSTNGDAVLLSKSSINDRSGQEEVHQPTTNYSAMLNFQDQGFAAQSVVAVPLRARQITVGKERRGVEERVIGNLMALNKRSGSFDDEDTQLLGILASQASTLLQIARLYDEANDLFLVFIEVLAATIDAKDPYTRGHSQRVSNLSMSIAQEMGMNGDLIYDLRIGSLLHDFGKIGVPDSILTKPARLTNKEYEQVKKHPSIGHRIIEQIEQLHNVLPAIIQHHERLDGSGYPSGLHGEQISLMGLIVAVADVFDALTIDRPYRKAMEVESAIDYLQQNSGTHFDGDCVDALIRTIN